MNAKTQTELEALKGIVAMLLAFARLCELASRAPHPVRSFVLWLLRRAEIVVRDWVDEEDEFGPDAIRVGNDPSDALGLAASFRELAGAVRDLAVEYREFARRWRHRGLAGEADGIERRVANAFQVAASLRRLLPLDVLSPAPFPDTS